MKKLTKILLINWLYFSKQLLEIDDINFLTGKNGAGKSTIIDALQIVLLGETNARNFNKAANDSSQRTLDGYLRADMDTNNPRSRRGKDFSSYIACEFWDDQSGSRFTAGIVFDCHSDGSRRDQFFLYDGPIPETCYLVSGVPMDIAALRAWLKAQMGPRYQMYDSNKRYREDLLAKWNVHNEQVCRMMKKAVSFRPIVNIQEFITENICDIPDKPDIEAMQQNIRDYKRDEELARRQEEKIERLTKIAQYFREYQAAVDRLQLHRFLALWAEKVSLEQQIEKLTVERDDCTRQIEDEENKSEELKRQVQENDRRKNELIADRAQNDVYKEQERLRRQQETLEQEQKRLMEGIGRTVQAVKREANVLVSLCRLTDQWPEDEHFTALKEAAGVLEKACLPLETSKPEIFSGSVAVFVTAQKATDGFAECLRKAAYEMESVMSGLREEMSQVQGTLAQLRKNIKDYPEGLLDLKNQLYSQLLTRYKRPVSVNVLADVLEIADGEEMWRGAVEGYLNTQKFYLLVDPDVYTDALEIFDRIKHQYRRQSFGLVDIGKLRERERLEAWDDSLAKKVQTDDPLARSYIDYLLGRVVCCTHTSQLRRHRTAVTAEGMLYQGYVARPMPKSKMEDAFIGRKAIDLRIEMLLSRQKELSDEERRLKPVCDELTQRKGHEFLFTGRFVQEAEQCQRDYVRGLEITAELGSIEDKLSHLDLFWLNELDKQIDELEKTIGRQRGEIEACSGRIGELKNRQRDLDYEKIPERNERLMGREVEIEGAFPVDYQNTVGLPRYKQEIERLKRASVVAKNFGDQVPRAQNDVAQTKNNLLTARRDYVQQFQPCSFRVDVMDNQEFDDERKRLEESELPRYREKIKLARESALEQFQNDFLAKLRDGIQNVDGQVKNLNRALKQAQFGTDQYQFKVERNPDYAAYYDMIMAPELIEGEGGLFALPFQQKYGPLIEDLFGRITASDDTQTNARKQSELQKNIELYTDFRTYLKFDLETTDPNGNKQLLSQTLNTKSGGETQTPFYIAVLASFAQLYRVNDTSSFGNTVRLIVFDEAFNKMDSDRIIESVRLLRRMHLQAIICTPPDKLPDIMPQADRTLLVCRERYTMQVLPYTKEVKGAWSEM